jgi:hypothetical protein
MSGLGLEVSLLPQETKPWGASQAGPIRTYR